ncbi:YpjP family protein [Amphibacillus sp. Q70]|uniref:YpjP family protein n=1 Tax=Amphibacillus sp. Q70 TaxID=3453416 RepID=UPI003F8617DD
MKIWLKRLFVATVAIMTLGFYVPPIDLDINAETDNKEIESEKKPLDKPASLIYEPPVYLEDLDDHQIVVLDPAEELIEQAKDRMIEKLGPRILSQLNDEMTEEVLPNLELIVMDLIETNDPDMAFNLSIIEDNIPGYGEKIFDLYDEQTDQIIAKFHVRRENRPLEGYWFNFHYHLAEDQFETHHALADVYWSKNTPPKWMS